MSRRQLVSLGAVTVVSGCSAVLDGLEDETPTKPDIPEDRSHNGVYVRNGTETTASLHLELSRDTADDETTLLTEDYCLPGSENMVVPDVSELGSQYRVTVTVDSSRIVHLRWTPEWCTDDDGRWVPADRSLGVRIREDDVITNRNRCDVAEVGHEFDYRHHEEFVAADGNCRPRQPESYRLIRAYRLR